MFAKFIVFATVLPCLLAASSDYDRHKSEVMRDVILDLEHQDIDHAHKAVESLRAYLDESGRSFNDVSAGGDEAAVLLQGLKNAVHSQEWSTAKEHVKKLRSALNLPQIEHEAAVEVTDPHALVQLLKNDVISEDWASAKARIQHLRSALLQEPASSDPHEVISLLKEDVTHGDWSNAHKHIVELKETLLAKLSPQEIEELELQEEVAQPAEILLAMKRDVASGDFAAAKEQVAAMREALLSGADVDEEALQKELVAMREGLLQVANEEKAKTENPQELLALAKKAVLNEDWKDAQEHIHELKEKLEHQDKGDDEGGHGKPDPDVVGHQLNAAMDKFQNMMQTTDFSKDVSRDVVKSMFGTVRNQISSGDYETARHGIAKLRRYLDEDAAQPPAPVPSDAEEKLAALQKKMSELRNMLGLDN